MRRRAALLATELWLPIALVAGWWLVTASSTSLYFPPAERVLSTLWGPWLDKHLTTDLLPSLVVLGVGVLIAVVAGIALGTLLGRSPTLLAAANPTLEFLRAVPGVALIPVALLVFGIGTTTVIAVVAYAATWPVLVNTIDGVRRVDPVALDVAALYQLRRRSILTAVVAGSAAPQVLPGVRTAISIGINALIFAEMIGSARGIGYAVLQSQRTYAITDMWAGILVLGMVGYLLNTGFRGLERFVLRSHPTSRPTLQETT